MSKNLSELSARKGLQENLFEKLGTIAKSSGTPTVQDMEALAQEFLIGKANVYGSATFYDFTRPDNQGKKIYVCNGSACMTAHTQDHVSDTVQKHFAANEVGAMCCLGRCHENAAFHYQGKNYSGEDIKNLKQILEDKITSEDSYTIKATSASVLTLDDIQLDEYVDTYKSLLKKDRDLLLADIQASGLRGRGGAGFPTAFKMQSTKNTPSELKFVVCNADEGDPGAYSDRYLLEQRPLSVLIGMIYSGYITGASHGVVYIRAEYPEAIEIVKQKVDSLRTKNYIGKNIFGTDFSFDFKVIAAQGAYICGEETALLSSIEGQRPEVRVRPPYPAQEGLFNKPTIVNNVESLACIPYIVQGGAPLFSSLGTEKSKGTKLVSLDGHFVQPGIYEVEMGFPLKKLIYEVAGGFKNKIKALHIGGPLGGIVPVSKIDDMTIDFESFAQHGFLLGHASIVCIPEDFPMVEYIQHLFQFTAHESCGKCFPCRIGSVRGAELLSKAQKEDFQIDPNLFYDLLDTLQLGSLCALGGGLPLPIRNAMQYFESELQPYFKK